MAFPNRGNVIKILGNWLFFGPKIIYIGQDSSGVCFWDTVYSTFIIVMYSGSISLDCCCDVCLLFSLKLDLF